MSGVRIPPPRPLFRPYRHGRRSWVITQSVVAVAHQVEHRIVAPEVVGSRPISHPIFRRQRSGCFGRNSVILRPSDQVFRTFLSHLRRADTPRLLAGIRDYVLKTMCKDVRHYEDFVRNTFLSGDRVRALHSHTAVTEIKNTTERPLVTQL